MSPLEEIIITEDSILPSGTIDPTSGDFNEIPGMVDSDGLIPNTRMDPPRKRAESGGDVKEFARLMWLLMSFLDSDLRFAHAYPDLITDQAEVNEFADQTQRDKRVPHFKDTITWKVTRREPGSIGDKPFGPAKQWKPRIMDRAVKDPNDPDVLIDIYEADFDNIIQFDIFSEANSVCEDLSEWFEDQIVLYQGFFIKMGIPRVLFLKRTVDERVDLLATALNTRSLQYYVRTKRYYQINNSKMREIHLKLLAIINTEEEIAKFETGVLQDELFSD